MDDKKYFLGINEGHCSTAALIQDGRLVACVSEERLSRRKNQSGFPVLAVRECLRIGGISADEVSLIYLSGLKAPPLISDADGYAAWSTVSAPSNWFSVCYRLREKTKFFKPIDQYVANLAGAVVSPITKKQRVETASRLTGIPAHKFRFVEHHYAHAASAIFGSGRSGQDLLVITIDGEGDLLSATVGTWKNGAYQRLASSPFTDSLGHFYASVTGFMGMKRGEHEYKIMGLAPYGVGREADEILAIFNRLIHLDGSNLRINTRMHSHTIEDHLPKLLLHRRFDHIAAATQVATEGILYALVKAAVAKTGIRDIVAAGGTFMNIKANHGILCLPEVRSLYVTPSCGDDSLAIGCCYEAHRENIPGQRPEPLSSLYLGGDPQAAGLAAHAQAKGFRVETMQDSEETIAGLLACGEIVARCSGRMEFGARALCNRSLMADASVPGVVDRINRAIKHRDFWMPFAPVIMAEKASEYVADHELIQKTNPEFMMLGFESTERARKDLAGALHPYDKTMRPQVLKRENNPQVHKILELYAAKTGRFGLLNTSFNIHGEPIVNTAVEAVDVLARTDLSYLAVEDCLVSKPRGCFSRVQLTGYELAVKKNGTNRRPFA